jgi:hypothetical protein
MPSESERRPDPAKHHVGSFAEGDETLPEDTHRGSFAEGQDT